MKIVLPENKSEYFAILMKKESQYYRSFLENS